MRHYLLFCFLIYSASSIAQNLVEDNFPTEDGKIFYQGVVNVDSAISDQDLYLNAKEWIIESFGSSDDVIVTDDRDLNILIVKGFIAKGHNVSAQHPKNWFTLKIEMKDGRYRYTLHDIIYDFTVSMGTVSKDYSVLLEEWLVVSDAVQGKKREKMMAKLNTYCSELDSQFKLTIESLDKRMQKQRDDEW